jgi:phosphatidylinositol-3-phosphatase
MSRLTLRAAAVLAPLATLVTIAACGPTTATTMHPAGRTSADRAPAHIVVIFMENHALSYILKSPAIAPYENALWSGTADTPSEDMTAYRPLASPSLPNYLAVASGSTWTTNDAVQPGQFAGPTLWDQLTGAGTSWGVYEEGMPSACSGTVTYNDTATDGQYVLRHNPAIPFSTVWNSPAECANVRPLSALNRAALPAVSFITPNVCDDMHGIPPGAPDPFKNCVKGSPALTRRSDTWLANLVPRLVGSGATVFITYDECCSTYPGTLFAVETGPGVVNGSSFTAATNHEGLLAGIERAEGLPLLGDAASANPVPFP